MPISTPNRVAQPVTLESYDPLCVIRQASGMNIPWTNITGSTVMAGEIVICNGKACIAAGTILPGKEGRVEAEWMADIMLDTALVGDVLAGASVYLDYSKEPIADNIGGATNIEPTNGILIGKACRMPGETRVNGSGKPIAATAGDKRIRVVSTGETAETYGTIPTFS